MGDPAALAVGRFFTGYSKSGKAYFMTFGAEDIQEQNARVARLEFLYRKSLRFRKDHPWHGHYTGLFELYKNHPLMTAEIPSK